MLCKAPRILFKDAILLYTKGVEEEREGQRGAQGEGACIPLLFPVSQKKRGEEIERYVYTYVYIYMYVCICIYAHTCIYRMGRLYGCMNE